MHQGKYIFAQIMEFLLYGFLTNSFKLMNCMESIMNKTIQPSPIMETWGMELEWFIVSYPE
jgi:hypothetical protein